MAYLHAGVPRSDGTQDDPWQTAGDEEVWAWDGDGLVPAPPDAVAMLRERDALRRLRAWEGPCARIDGWAAAPHAPRPSIPRSSLIAWWRRAQVPWVRPRRPDVTVAAGKARR